VVGGNGNGNGMDGEGWVMGGARHDPQGMSLWEERLEFGIGSIFGIRNDHHD